MPFIDTTPATFTPRITESDLQPRLGDLLATQGWTVAANFKKVSFDAGTLKSTYTATPQSSFPIAVAEHFIYANKEGHMFGLALIGQWSTTVGELGALGKSPVKGATPLPEFAQWATNEFRKFRSPQTMYFYIVEELRGLKPNGNDICLPWVDNSTDGLKRAVLDIEVEASEWVTSGSSSGGVFTITKAEGLRMQSPIVSAGIRSKLIESYYDSQYNSAVQYTNWWHDSELSIKGTLTDTNAFFIIQSDNVPAPEGNLVPIIPFYFGKLDPIEEGDEAYAMFAGTVPIATTVAGVAEYDFDDLKNKQANIMPLIKNYPANPANGLDNVMIHRAKLGARYQASYLSWNSPANAMPPARSSVDGKRDYPRAWNNSENPLYKYNFNPSRYSGKVHTSKIYVVHPEEGVRGTLKDAIALAAFSFNANKLRVKRTNCPDEFDVYRYFLVEGVSPLTKKPGTQFRPAGLGLYLNTVDDEGIEITSPTTP
ncbi:hypothetical protein [Paenibacillus sp. 276b]|uniref:hypothetical protein n=1 Tax=Paenibacillus sp. 276b TaxID=1566277 RepID=UPI00089B770D|nr:hypothetical protein [Paenibacillus sp. 276b]SEA79938.1 hypothetical protein SAMN03159332_2601 [Paenibacillus sp. 276b]